MAQNAFAMANILIGRWTVITGRLLICSSLSRPTLQEVGRCRPTHNNDVTTAGTALQCFAFLRKRTQPLSRGMG